MIEKLIEAVSGNLTAVLLLGMILGVIALANIVLGTIYNVADLKKPFEIKKFFLGFLKAIVVFLGVCLLTSGVSMIPVVAEAINLTEYLGEDIISAFSIGAITFIMAKSIISQGTGAYENLTLLWGAKTEQQKIAASYTVEDEIEYKEGK